MPIPKSNGPVDAVPFRVSLVISEKNNLPCLEIRRATTDPELIKEIISCAFHAQPFIVMPAFTDRLRSLATLTDKGILYRDDDQYYFNI